MRTETTISPGEPQPEPRIRQFENLAAGLFIHWGLYSLLGRGEWVMQHESIPSMEYYGLMDHFTAEAFNPKEWAQLAKEAGMRYACLTTRHHDGFSLYDTKGLSRLDAPHSAAGCDLVKEFVDAFRQAGITPYFYHTTLDWNWHSDTCDTSGFANYIDYLVESVEILCRDYGPIGGFWFDGSWSRKDQDWQEDRLYGVIRRYQPEAIITNNTGLQARGERGHPELDCLTFEQDLPHAPDRNGWPKYLAGEMCRTLNLHWGQASNDLSFRGPKEVIEDLCNCRKVGANMLLNIGPNGDGSLPDYECALLQILGKWIHANREPIHSAYPTNLECTGNDFVLARGNTYYYFAFGLGLVGSENVVLQEGNSGTRTITGISDRIRSVHWLDTEEALSFKQEPDSDKLVFDATGFAYGSNQVVRIARIRT